MLRLKRSVGLNEAVKAHATRKLNLTIRTFSYENNPSHCCKDNVQAVRQCPLLPGYYGHNSPFEIRRPDCIIPAADYPAACCRHKSLYFITS